MGKESALPYGQALFDITLEPVASSIATAFEQWPCRPQKARKFAEVLPLFDHFQDPTHVAAVGLTAVIDQLHRCATRHLRRVGWAIERETRLIQIWEIGPTPHAPAVAFRLESSPDQQHQGPAGDRIPSEWTDLTRLQIGAFLVDHMTQTGLFKVVRHRVGHTQPRMVVPSDEAWSSSVTAPSAATAPFTQPCFARRGHGPELFGGGRLDNDEPLCAVPIADHDTIR